MREPTSGPDAANLLRESTLPHVERMVLTEIAWHWPEMSPSIICIVQHTGLSLTKVIEALHRLAKQGVLRVTSANRYFIYWGRIQEAEPENPRATVNRLRQDLAEAQRRAMADRGRQ